MIPKYLMYMYKQFAVLCKVWALNDELCHLDLSIISVSEEKCTQEMSFLKVKYDNFK